MIIKANVDRHPKRLDPEEYHICAVEMLPIDKFRKIQMAPMDDYPVIANHVAEMGIDLSTGHENALLLINDANMDGILVDGWDDGHCECAAYLPGIRGAIEYQLMGMVYELVESTLETTSDPDCLVPWEKLNEQLGFKATEQSGLWEAVGNALEEHMDVRGWELKKEGIDLSLEPMAWDIFQDKDPDFSMGW